MCVCVKLLVLPSHRCAAVLFLPVRKQKASSVWHRVNLRLSIQHPLHRSAPHCQPPPHTHWSKKPRSASLHPSIPPPPLSDSPSLSLCLTKSVHSHLISTRQNGDATTAGKVNYTRERQFLTAATRWAELCSSFCRRFLNCWLLIWSKKLCRLKISRVNPLMSSLSP